MAFDRKIENLIANLRGLPESTSRASLRKERQLSDVLEKLEFKDSYQRRRYDSILKNWEILIGRTYASRCQPARLLEGGSTLVIHVPNATLRQHLQFEKPQLLQKLQKLPYCKTIRNLVLLSS